MGRGTLCTLHCIVLIYLLCVYYYHKDIVLYSVLAGWEPLSALYPGFKSPVPPLATVQMAVTLIQMAGTLFEQVISPVSKYFEFY